MRVCSPCAAKFVAPPWEEYGTLTIISVSGLREPPVGVSDFALHPGRRCCPAPLQALKARHAPYFAAHPCPPPDERTLLYFTVAGSEQYLQLLRLLLVTLRPDVDACPHAIQLAVLAHPYVEARVAAILNETLGPAVAGLGVLPPLLARADAVDVFGAAVNKLNVRALLDAVVAAAPPTALASSPTRVVYMDIDMLLARPLHSILAGVPLAADDGRVYAMGETMYGMDHEYFSIHQYTPQQLATFSAEGRQPVNTGFMMFRPLPGVLQAFDDALHYAQSLPVDKRPPFCYEQPILNHVLHTRAGGMVEWTALQRFISIDRKRTKWDWQELEEDVAVVHITGLSDDAGSIPDRKLGRARSIIMRLYRGAEHALLLQ